MSRREVDKELAASCAKSGQYRITEHRRLHSAPPRAKARRTFWGCPIRKKSAFVCQNWEDTEIFQIIYNKMEENRKDCVVRWRWESNDGCTSGGCAAFFLFLLFFSGGRFPRPSQHNLTETKCTVPVAERGRVVYNSVMTFCTTDSAQPPEKACK